MTNKASRSPYVTFYKVMLILSTIGTSIGALGVFSIPQVISEFHIAPVYNAALLAIAVNSAVAVLALVLLWQKKIEGLYIKIATYIVSIIASIVSLFSAQPYIAYVTEQSGGSTVTNLTPDQVQLVDTILGGILYAGLATSILLSIVFSFLWITAWKKQATADKEK